MLLFPNKPKPLGFYPKSRLSPTISGDPALLQQGMDLINKNKKTLNEYGIDTSITSFNPNPSIMGAGQNSANPSIMGAGQNSANPSIMEPKTSIIDSLRGFQENPSEFFKGGGQNLGELTNYLGQANQLFRATGQEGNLMDFILGSTPSKQEQQRQFNLKTFQRAAPGIDFPSSI